MGYIFSFYKTLIIKVKQIIFVKQTENIYVRYIMRSKYWQRRWAEQNQEKRIPVIELSAHYTQ